MLTDKAIRTAKPRDNHYWMSDTLQARGDGTLKVRVTPANKKVFEYHYRMDGKRKSVSLGAYPSMMLVEARTEVGNLIDEFTKGNDPRIVVASQKAVQSLDDDRGSNGDTMLDLIRAHLEDVEERNLKTKGRIKQCFEEWVLPNIDPTMPARDFTDEHFGDLQVKLHDQGYSVTSLDRLRHNLSAAFKYVLKNERNPLKRNLRKFKISRNPILDIPLHVPVSNGRERFLSKPELTKFWVEALAKPTGKWMSDKVRMAIMLMFLTGGQRTSEVASMRWADIDLTARIWHKKGVNTKNGLDHIVPLNNLAVTILEKLSRANLTDSPWVFPSRASSHTAVEHMSENTIGKAIKRFCFQEWNDEEIARKRREGEHYFTPFQARDIRRTCVSYLAEMGIERHIRNQIHNHNLKADVDDKHYDRHDYLREKREVLDSFEEHLLAICGVPEDEIHYFTQ